MQYYHENPLELHVGTLENRSYYIPYGETTGAMTGKRELSDRFTLLSGVWDFAFFDRIQSVPETIDYAASIPVPSVWQQHGYDRHQYTNVRYPFPYDPPYVPQNNPCGVYRRAFTMHPQEGMVYHLNFEGVDSCFYVHVNGQFVGFSQVSHSTSEFDITPFVRKGDNTLTVYVLKWCFGSYMEDQDKLRMSGIFRDVYILTRPANHLRDFFVHTQLLDADGAAEISIDLCKQDANLPITLSLFSPSDELLGTQTVTGQCATFTVDGALLWTAETPTLYTLLIQAGGEHIAQRVGIRTIRIESGVVLLNEKPIKFRGVNRHDSDPVTGYAISMAQMLHDMRLMKAHNVNAIRTSHYPNAPWVAELCDQYGFYLLSESDVECHGVVSLYQADRQTVRDQEAIDRHSETYSRIARDPMFEPAILDRVQRNVIRDKNSASVLIWSLGNESGYGPCLEKAGRWVKAYDPSRLTHYEGAVHLPPSLACDTSMLDLHSEMYSPLQRINDYFESQVDTRPFILCEYIHAMGNGPGDVWDYQQLIDKYPGFCGGFVWEFCDHAVYMGKTAKGKDKYFYGGDFGEYPHDGNFCMDGLVYPSRKPHTGFLEFKQVIRPIRAELLTDGTPRILFSNWLDFTTIDDAIQVAFTLTCGAQVIQEGTIDLPRIAPHGSAEVPLPCAVPDHGTYLLLLVYKQKYDQLLTCAGHELGRDQLVLREGVVPPPIEAKNHSKNPPHICETSTHVILLGDHFTYTWNKITGLFDTMVYRQQSLLVHPMDYNIWRAPTDNDRNVRRQWEEAGYDCAKPRVYTVNARQADGMAVIEAVLSLGAVYRQRIIDIDVAFTIDGDGKVAMRLHGKRNTEMPFLPRFGIRLFMPKVMQKAAYFGYGPYESYVDKRQASWLGLFHTTAAQNHEDYIKPQENGSHYGCSYVQITDGAASLYAYAGTPFSFNISPYTQEELAQKAHNYELEPADCTVLCLDYKLSGIGSNSCGPVLQPIYRFDEEDFTYTLTLAPDCAQS